MNFVPNIDTAIRDPRRLNIPNTNIQNCKDYLKILFSIINGTWSGANESDNEIKIIQKYLIEISNRLVSCLRIAFEVSSSTTQSDNTAMSAQFDIGLASVALACLFSLV